MRVCLLYVKLLNIKPLISKTNIRKTRYKVLKSFPIERIRELKYSPNKNIVSKIEHMRQLKLVPKGKLKTKPRVTNTIWKVGTNYFTNSEIEKLRKKLYNVPRGVWKPNSETFSFRHPITGALVKYTNIVYV